MMGRIRDHFRVPASERTHAQCAEIHRLLLSHPTWFDAFLEKRFKKEGVELTSDHIDVVRDVLSAVLFNALSAYPHTTATRGYAYLKELRNKTLTAYFQRFQSDVLPGRRPFRE
ncbi:hypothetical protein HY994_05410 [Candidatus Micrarchaeota archaeon]|nr:hypothetical protein [Candidatus Micrarchaeota archaeon]